MLSSSYIQRQILLSITLLGLLIVSPIRSQTGEKMLPVYSNGVERAEPATNPFHRGESLQRIPAGVFENVPNTVSNVEMFFSNYGIFGLHVQTGSAGGIWPRGSGQRYIFGGGIWFAAKKFTQSPGGSSLKKMSIISYNPNTGGSWMVPGRILEPYGESDVDQSSEGISNYRLYRSTDYDLSTGEPTDPDDLENNAPRWPIWDTDPFRTLRENHYFGNYIEERSKRSLSVHPEGPAILSGEDIVAVFRDTDLSRNELGEEAARAAGYPLGIQTEQTAYSWGFGGYQDMIIIRYRFINRSPDTLYECWAAPVIDLDIGDAYNDRTRAAILNRSNDSLNLGVAWSEREGLEYGYLGCDILESPAIDNNGFVRKDKEVYTVREQLGMATLRNWVVDIDPTTPEERYDFMATSTLDDDNGPGDKRFLMATGPFSMLPGDTATMAIALLFAPSPAGRPSGTWEDMVNLIELDRFAQMVYDSMVPTSGVEEETERWRFFKEPDLR